MRLWSLPYFDCLLLADKATHKAWEPMTGIIKTGFGKLDVVAHVCDLSLFNGFLKSQLHPVWPLTKVESGETCSALGLLVFHSPMGFA